jgi:1-acyl-sn-glycerol-3-phosphate acyltransferase
MQYHQSYMIVANHTSMADIMLMLQLKSFCFVGKKNFLNSFVWVLQKTCILVDEVL